MGALSNGPEWSHEDQLEQDGVKNHLQLELLSKFSPEAPSEQTPQLTDPYHHGDQ